MKYSAIIDCDTRKLARQIVDDFTYELHHAVTEPKLDFTRVSSKEIVLLIDHIQKVIEQAIEKK